MASKEDLPEFVSYFIPSVHAFRQQGGSLSIEEMETIVADKMQLPDEIRAIMHGDGPKTQFQYELAWVRTYLKKGGIAENSTRGVWHLSSLGLSIPDQDIALLPKKIRTAAYEKRRASKSDQDTHIDEIDVDEARSLDWKERLLDLLQGIEPAAFERLSQRILREAGFIKVEVTGKSGDGGIDGTGVLRMNLIGFNVLFQCKRYKGSVGASTVRDFRGAMVGRADKGLIITTGNFTPDARREATRDGAPAIELLDGDALCELLKQYRIGVKVEMVESILLDPEVFRAV
jgi:restriction system protein